MVIGRFLDARNHVVGNGTFVSVLARIRHRHSDEHTGQQTQESDEKPFQTRIFLLSGDSRRCQRSRFQDSFQFFDFTCRRPIRHVFRPNQSVGSDAHFTQFFDAERTLMFLVLNNKILFHHVQFFKFYFFIFYFLLFYFFSSELSKNSFFTFLLPSRKFDRIPCATSTNRR